MDPDILVLTDSYFEEFFADRITTQDRDDIKQWLTLQLQQERQGWKNKLNMSLKEIERERKVALENQTALNNVHSLLVQFVQAYGPILSLDSMDKIKKSSLANQVEYYAQQLFDLVNHFEDERVKCFDLLNLKDYQQMYLFEALKANIEHFRDRIRETQTKAAENEKNLKEEIEIASNKLKEEKKRSELEQSRLNRMIQILRDELEKLKNQGAKVEKPPVSKSNIAVQVEAWSLCKTQHSETQTESLVLDSEKNETETNLIPVAFKSVKEPDMVRLYKLDIGTDAEANLSDSLHLSSFNEDELNTLNVNEELDLRPTRKKSKKEKKRNRKKHVSDDLRNQVVNYAEKLDKAKIDVDMYHQQQLVGIKVSPIKAAYKPSRYGDMWNTSPHDRSSGREFLSGVQKDLLYSSRDRNLVATLHANKRKGYDYNNRSTSKCLRCHRTYKVKDNHQFACTFHPKSKRKLEKYDTGNRLVKIVYRWDCCHQKAESPGCCSGEHI